MENSTLWVESFWHLYLIMKKYILTYSLNNDGDYTELYKTIKEIYPNNFHPFNGTWIIVTDDNADDISNKLHDKFLNENVHDNYLIMRLDYGVDYQGFVPLKFWKFLEKNKC